MAPPRGRRGGLRGRAPMCNDLSRLGAGAGGLGARVLEPELMDDPELDGAAHREALRALARINRLSRTAGRVWREVRRAYAARQRTVRLLDLACGDGHVALAVARRARRAGVPLQVEGWDVSPRAVALARDAARARGVEAGFHVRDVLAAEPPRDVDVLSCVLFLHHLTEEQAVRFLGRVRAAGPGVLLLQDLRRSRAGYLLAWLTLHTLVRSAVARVDGLRSVRAAFTPEEAARLCARAGLRGAEVRPAWPQRFVVRWVGAS